MRSVEPEAFLVARPKVDYDAMAAYPREVGGERWLERLDREQFEAQDLAEFAGRICYDIETEILADSGWKRVENLRHGSVLEHASFTFVLHNVSRVFSHEIVRHRPGTAISQESLRYVRLDELPFWFPDWAREDAELMKRATALLAELEEFQLWMAGHFGLDDDDTKMHEKKHKTSFMRRFAPEGVPHDVKVYPGAGHGFMSRGPKSVAPLAALARLDYKPEAAQDARRRILAFLGEYLGSEEASGD